MGARRRAAAGRWRATARPSRRCTASARPSTSGRPTRSCSAATAPRRAAPRPCCARWPPARCPPGLRLLWAASASGAVPGVGRPRRAGARRPGRCAPTSRRFAVTDDDRGRAVRGPRHAGWPGVVEIPAGEQHKTRRDRRARLARAGGAGRAPRRPPRRRGRRRGGRPGRLLRRDLPARHPGRAGPDDARGPGRLGLRRQDRRRPARGQELRRRLPPAGRASSPTPRTLDTLPAAELAAGYAEVVKTALIAGGALWERVASGAPVDDAVDRRLRAHQAARRGRRRARRRPAPGAQPRPHGRPRAGDRDRLRAPAPRRGGRARACWRPCASRAATTCATRVAGLLAAAGLPVSIDGDRPRRGPGGDGARQEAHGRRAGRLRALRRARRRCASASRWRAATCARRSPSWRPT